MKTHPAKRVEIMIEALMERRLTEALHATGATGYTILPVLGGSGSSGPWTREGQVSRASGMIAVVCILRPDRLDDVLEAVYAVVENHIGVVSVSNCEVVRDTRF